MKSFSQTISVAEFTSFKIGGEVPFFAHIQTEEELIQALEEAKKLRLKVHILGGGSNTIFHEGDLNIAVLKMEMKGIKIVADAANAVGESDGVLVEIGAGENWDEVVRWSVEHNFSGIEALSAIPGTTGATPIQNVGAYGQEIKDTLVKVVVMDRNTYEVREMSAEECELSYRDSIFKKKDNPFIILSIVLKLTKVPTGQSVEIPNYPDVKTYFSNPNKNPTLQEIRNAIIEIRSRKLPDPSVIPNAGSFFKNVIVQKDIATLLKLQFNDLPQFESGNKIKIPAGWLIEQVGFKGKVLGQVGVYPQNALVLTNLGAATYEDLARAREEIVHAVREKFGLVLEQEPVEVE